MRYAKEASRAPTQKKGASQRRLRARQPGHDPVAVEDEPNESALSRFSPRGRRITVPQSRYCAAAASLGFFFFFFSEALLPVFAAEAG